MEVLINKDQFDVIASALDNLSTPLGLSLLSSLLALVTAGFSLWSARSSEKSAAFAAMPTAFFILRSARTLCNRMGTDFSSIPDDDKLLTQFIIRNDSKFPIIFKVDIALKAENGEIIEQKAYWNEPLHIYPGGMGSYPLIALNSFSQNVLSSKRIITAEIKYTYAPRVRPKEAIKTMYETWRFDLKEYIWRGPAGIEDSEIFLPGEKIDIKLKQPTVGHHE